MKLPFRPSSISLLGADGLPCSTLPPDCKVHCLTWWQDQPWQESTTPLAWADDGSTDFPALGPPSGPFRVRFGVFSAVRFPCTACPFSAGASFWWCFVRPLGFPLAPGSWLSRVCFWYQGGENNNQFAYLFRLKMRPLVVFSFGQMA